MSAFITGGTGFIGKRLVRRLMRTHRQHLVDRRPNGAAALLRLCRFESGAGGVKRLRGERVPRSRRRFRHVDMPLVRTEMIDPIKFYEHVPTLDPAEAANLVVEALIRCSARVATRLGRFGQAVRGAAPNM